MQENTFRTGFANMALSVWVLVFSAAAPADEPVYDPTAVKAAFIYHFATFVTWPGPDPTAGPEVQPFTIAVLGADRVEQELQLYLPGRRIQGRPIEVRKIQTLARLDHAEVLFIGVEREAELSQLTAAIRDQPVLVVADTPGALELGSIINFVIVDNRLRFEVSLPAAECAGLSLSSRLLAAAFQVYTSDMLDIDCP